jgi:hypothetical protein
MNAPLIMDREIEKIWGLLAVGDDSVLEIRALWPKGSSPSKPAVTKHFRVKDFDSKDACKREFESAAIKLNELGYNIYSVMNPIKADFTGKAATDADIRFYDLLLIDVDRKGDTSCPATQEELAAAEQLASEISQYLGEKNWPEPMTVMSGNGYHLYYPLAKLENVEESTALVKATLSNLAKKFDNTDVGVDKLVYNPSRITKVPGTIMRKGAQSEGRPYRTAKLL